MVSQNQYAAVHLEPNGPGDARPTALQIVKDNDMEGKLKGKVALITGTSSGIGIPTVAAIAATGATIYAAARDVEKNKKALAGIEGAKIEYLKLDLSSPASVREAAAEFLKRSGGQLNLLINNAGVMAIQKRTLTAEGQEMQFATNHLGHFLFFELLKDALLASSTPEYPSRVVNLSSGGHRMSPVHFDDLTFEGEYQPFAAYGQAKTANILMTNYIERQYGSKGLHGLAVHPGTIFTDLGRHLTEADFAMLGQMIPNLDKIAKSPEQGAATSILAAIGKDYNGKGGIYLEEAGEWGPAESGLTGPGYADYAFNKENEDRLWDVSLKLVGLTK
jgi:NAD(P)-dependent dehydrogenase (short-subunit alcohol dehydrogenase family)